MKYNSKKEIMLGNIIRFGSGLKLFKDYSRTIKYLLKTRGLKAAYNFLWAKLIVRETGPGVLDPVFRTFPKAAPYGRYIEYEVTTKCNLRCAHCERTHWEETPQDMTYEQFKKVFDQFPKLKWVNATGEGTAFLNKDYFKMLEYFKKKDTYVELVESLYLMNDDWMRRLIKLGIDRIWVSIDGATKKTYEGIKIGSDFDRVIKNLKRFVELKKEMNSPIPEFCFRYVISKNNMKEMEQFVEMINGIACKKDFGDASYIEFAGLLEFDNIMKMYVNEVPDDIITKVSNKGRELGVKVRWSHHKQDKKIPVTQCAAWTEPYIMMGGYVMPCCGVVMSNKRPYLRKYALGNVYKKSFKEIWNSRRYKKFRKTVNQSKGPVYILCKDCRAFDTMERQEKYGTWK